MENQSSLTPLIAAYLTALLVNETEPEILNMQQAALRDFLSLYALTQGDVTPNNGTWEELPVQNGEAVRAALFGSGQKAGGLITATHIGGLVENSNNPYRNINNILGQLGIASSNVEQHYHHFHVYLQPPELMPLIQNLNADVQSDPKLEATSIAAQADAQSLLDYTQSIITGEELMFIMDVPSVPPQETPIVLAQAGSMATTVPLPDYLLKECQETEHTGNRPSALRSVDPAGLLRNFIESARKAAIDDLSLFKPSLLQGAQHGKITESVSNSGRIAYRYDPNPGYIGDDQAIFMVEFEGKHYKFILQIKVMEYVPNRTTCPPPQLIKINGKPVSGSNGFDSGYNLNSVTVTFADLPGGAVGQTVGNTITLDNNAAGHTWFIDTTPADNSEYLPTHNPNEWVCALV